MDIYNILTNMSFVSKTPMRLYCDNQLVTYIVQNPVFHENKNIDVDCHVVWRKYNAASHFLLYEPFYTNILFRMPYYIAISSMDTTLILKCVLHRSANTKIFLLFKLIASSLICSLLQLLTPSSKFSKVQTP